MEFEIKAPKWNKKKVKKELKKELNMAADCEEGTTL